MDDCRSHITHSSPGRTRRPAATQNSRSVRQTTWETTACARVVGIRRIASIQRGAAAGSTAACARVGAHGVRQRRVARSSPWQLHGLGCGGRGWPGAVRHTRRNRQFAQRAVQRGHRWAGCQYRRVRAIHSVCKPPADTMRATSVWPSNDCCRVRPVGAVDSSAPPAVSSMGECRESRACDSLFWMGRPAAYRAPNQVRYMAPGGAACGQLVRGLQRRNAHQESLLLELAGWGAAHWLGRTDHNSARPAGKAMCHTIASRSGAGDEPRHKNIDIAPVHGDATTAWADRGAGTEGLFHVQ